MLAIAIIFQLSFIVESLAGTGLRFSKDPTAFAVFKGWNAKTNGSLKFHFRTYRKNGFLVYEDDKGQCQFISLSLLDGRLRLRLKMGNCEETQSLLVGHNLADGEWHKVTVQRNYSVTKVTVDGKFSNSTYYTGDDRYVFGGTSDLLVGGIPWYTKYNDLSLPAIRFENFHLNRFQGCISGIMHNGGRGPLKEAHLLSTYGTTQDCLDPCSQSDRCMNGGVCRDAVSEVWCDCKGTGYEGSNCTEEAASIWLNGSGYIVFHVDPSEENSHSNMSYVAFGLRTHAPNGVIFSLHQSHSDNDYLFIEMVDGKIRVEVDLGQGEVVLPGRGIHVYDRQWHWVEFSRRGRAMTLKIDGIVLADGKMSGKKFQLNVEGPDPKVYLAGGPKNVFVKSQSKMNFSGEIREFNFRNMKLLDYVVPTITDKRFETVGSVIDGSTIAETSGSGCQPLDDDDEDASCGDITTETTTDDMTSSSSTSEPTTDPSFLPTGAQAHVSLPQVVPFWVISVLVVVAAIAILVTIFFLYRWNSRYSGSFKPEPASSSGDLPQHVARTQISKPRIYVSAHEEKA